MNKKTVLSVQAIWQNRIQHINVSEEMYYFINYLQQTHNKNRVNI